VTQSQEIVNIARRKTEFLSKATFLITAVSSDHVGV
jgi:hypothetical protein